MTVPENEGANTRAYTMSNDSGKVFEVHYQTGENDKMVAAKIIYPFTHKLNIEYGKNDSLVSISDATSAKKHHIDFISEYDRKYEEKVVYNGELYSYGSREMNAKGRPVEIVFRMTFLGIKFTEGTLTRQMAGLRLFGRMECLGAWFTKAKNLSGKSITTMAGNCLRLLIL